MVNSFSEYIRFKNERNLEEVLDSIGNKSTQEQNIELNNQNLDEQNR